MPPDQQNDYARSVSPQDRFRAMYGVFRHSVDTWQASAFRSDCGQMHSRTNAQVSSPGLLALSVKACEVRMVTVRKKNTAHQPYQLGLVSI